MFIEFSVANFRSIRTRQTLSMVASRDTSHAANNVSPSRGVELRSLRSAVIYGPNAAGKSNLLLAIETFRRLVQGSAKAQVNEPMAVSPFRLAKASADRPSVFDIVFIADDGVRYHYYCAVSRERVEKEWLVAYPRGRGQRWFEREYEAETGRQTWWFGPKFRAERGERRIWQDFTRPNALFLSTVIQLNNAQVRPVFDWITNKLIVLLPGNVDLNPMLSLDLLREPEEQERIMRFMRAADIGINKLELHEEELPSDAPQAPLLPGSMRIHLEVASAMDTPGAANHAKLLRVRAWHKMIDSAGEIPLDLSDESDGTKKLFEFIGGWLRALEWGATLFVDELDRSLHPYMTRFLVGLFHDRNNTKNAQLVFTTHDTTLLDPNLLRRDQIWFVEKDKQSASQFYSLLDYSPRKDEALERGYLKGRYGAIPLIGRFEF